MKTNTFIPKIRLFVLGIAILSLTACGSSTSDKKASITEAAEEPAQPAMMTFSTNSEPAINAYEAGIKHFFLGNRNVAQMKLDQAIAADPDFTMAIIYRGFTSRSAKEFADYGEKAMALRPKASEAEKMMIDIYQALLTQDVEKRMEIAEKLATTYPNDHMAQYELINIYGAMDMEGKGRTLLESMVKQDPTNAVSHMRLAGSYMFDEPKDQTKALNHAKRAVALEPNMARPHIILGDSYRAQNNLEQALRSYQKAVDIDKTDFIAHSKKGHVNTYLGNYEQARADFEAAQPLAPNPMGMIMFKASTYLYAGDHEQALAILDAASADIPNSEVSEDRKTVQAANCARNSALIALYHRDGEKLSKYVNDLNTLSDQIAIDLGTEQAKILNGADNILWNARLAMVNGDFEAAVKQANLFKEKTSQFDDPYIMKDYHLTMGLISMDQKDYPNAIEHFKQTDKNDVFSQYHLGKAYEMNGQASEAATIYDKWKNYNFNDVGYALVRSEIQNKAS